MSRPAPMSDAFPHPKQHAALVWFDPGETIGIVVLTVRPRWLTGAAPPTWEALGKNITNAWFAQVGAMPALVNEMTGKKATPQNGRVVRGKTGRTLGVPADSLSLEHRGVLQCEDLLELWPRAAWGYEDFIPRDVNGSRSFLSPVRVFSVLAYNEIVYGRGRQPFVQSSSTAKTTATDERMQAADLYRPGLPHATDAARHAAVFLREARTDEALRRMAWPHLFRTTTEGVAS